MNPFSAAVLEPAAEKSEAKSTFDKVLHLCIKAGSRNRLSCVSHARLYAFSGPDGRDLTNLVPHDAPDCEAIHGHVLIFGPLVMMLVCNLGQFLVAVGVCVCVSTLLQKQSNAFQEEINE